MGAFLRATDKLFTSGLALLPTLDTATNLYKIERLSDAYSVVQHHDAVAGTERQHVAFDYAERLSIGETMSQEVVATTLAHLTSRDHLPKFTFCPLINESLCPAMDALSQGDSVPIVIYNPIGWRRYDFVKLPIPISSVEGTDYIHQTDF
jgi:hypothetical protein